jgi:hypothetical protein
LPACGRPARKAHDGFEETSKYGTFVFPSKPTSPVVFVKDTSTDIVSSMSIRTGVQRAPLAAVFEPSLGSHPGTESVPEWLSLLLTHAPSGIPPNLAGDP